MSYCRFQNTLSNLRDCAEHFEESGLDSEEHTARVEIYDLCKEIADNFERDDLE